MIDFIELAISWLKSFKMEYVINDAGDNVVSYTLSYENSKKITIETGEHFFRITIQHDKYNEQYLFNDYDCWANKQYYHSAKQLLNEINEYFFKNPELHKKFLKDKKLFVLKQRIKEKKKELKKIKKDIRRLKEELKEKKQELKIELAEIKEDYYDR